MNNLSINKQTESINDSYLSREALSNLANK
jgi:hypothetical protein